MKIFFHLCLGTALCSGTLSAQSSGQNNQLDDSFNQQQNTPPYRVERRYTPMYGRQTINLPADYTEDFYFFRRPLPPAYDQPSNNKAYNEYYNPNPQPYYVLVPNDQPSAGSNYQTTNSNYAPQTQQYSPAPVGQQMTRLPTDYTQDFYFFRRPVPSTFDTSTEVNAHSYYNQPNSTTYPTQSYYPGMST